MTDSNNNKSFPADFKRRVSEIKTTRWIRFGIVSVIFFAWVAWMGNWWLALLIFLLFDIYITGYIPFTWWKKSKNKTVRSVMSWVDAIVYALILVYFVFAFVGQNYQIPSSSLEKTLLTGDYLWVNKMIYGPRVPMTPVHFPLVHNKLPILNCNSYLESPSVSYKRLKGLRKVEEGDIVVFNFPAGDTVTSLYEDTPEYYDVLVRKYGRETIKANPLQFGQVIYRPVDRRQNFVKRAVGLPGDNFKIIDDTIYINGKAQAMPEHAQFNYLIATYSELTEDVLHKLGIAKSDLFSIGANAVERNNAMNLLPNSTSSSTFYIVPLSEGMAAELAGMGLLQDRIKYNHLMAGVQGENDYIFPEGIATRWTLSNYGGPEGLTIPAKGMTIELTPYNWLIYNRCIRNYEGHHDAYIKDGQVFIDGKPATHYTFAMDYYFMMGDNRDNSQDSRFWGFVPEDHIVGTPIMVLISFDRERSIFNGGIRWNRIFRDANPDK